MHEQPGFPLDPLGRDDHRKPRRQGRSKSRQNLAASLRRNGEYQGIAIPRQTDVAIAGPDVDLVSSFACDKSKRAAPGASPGNGDMAFQALMPAPGAGSAEGS